MKRAIKYLLFGRKKSPEETISPGEKEIGRGEGKMWNFPLSKWRDFMEGFLGRKEIPPRQGPVGGRKIANCLAIHVSAAGHTARRCNTRTYG
jgi:hypothetical protein